MISAPQARSRMTAGRASRGFTPQGSTSSFVMPYDHAASFELRGIPGNIVQDVINISSDGVFVATAIGYGFEEDRTRETPLKSPSSPQRFLPGDVTLGEIPEAALIEGFRLNVRSERLLLQDLPPGTDPLRERRFSAVQLDPIHRANVIERLKPAEDISFLFSIVDSGTGRELQDEPIHNLASLGRSDGDRPFRVLAQPLTFQPRSTVRLQIIERSEGVVGNLFIVLYGYKILGGAACGEESTRSVTSANVFTGQGIDRSRVIPFDYVSKFQLNGRPGNLHEDEIPINVEGGFVTTAIGYGLAVERLNVALNRTGLPAGAIANTTDLRLVRLSSFPVSALQEGIRIRPNFLTLAFGSGGELSDRLPNDALDRVFERLNLPEAVSFRYSIFDTGTGRELQNQPINNIAGLGIANGDRPFKALSRPMRFLPRSTIRVNIEERFGRGTLFIVFQGFKLLSGGSPGPTVPSRRARR